MPDKDSTGWRPGLHNLITDVPGLLVGNASDRTVKSGVTVLSAAKPFVASVDVMGGAPGTRETDCLGPDKLVSEVDALVLSGGSAFGLDAASGVVQYLREQNRGFSVGPVKVPIVPCAILFDLINGGASNWLENPYAELGRKAISKLGTGFELGSVGAGTGATTANLKGGLGSASLWIDENIAVGALVAANPHGSVVVPGSRHFWAAPFEMNQEFGGLGVAARYSPDIAPTNEKLRSYLALKNTTVDTSHSPSGQNTTIAIVATNVSMGKSELKRMAVAAQDGMSRAIVPSHTPFDGDLIFSLTTNEVRLTDPLMQSMQIGHAASICLSRAIARSVYHASPEKNDTLPCWQQI